jgi:putative aldouronate transport system substrate-binding protein
VKNRSKGIKKVKVSGLLAASMLLAVAAGCSSGGNQAGSGPNAQSSAGNAGAKSEQKTAPAVQPTITIMNAQYAETTAKDDVLGMKLLEDITGYDVKTTWVPQNVYQERINVTMASGEMPQAIRINNILDPTILNGIKAGMFWELTPYLNDFPNLKTYHPVINNGAKIDGKVYSVPRPGAISAFGTIIREDWLKKVGMKMPETLEELYAVAKAFKEQDPDGNGVNDTYGLMLYEGELSYPIFAAAGAPNTWKVENGKFIKAEETAEYIEGLKFFRRMYKDGLINAKFPIVPRNEVRNDLYNGKVGMSIESVDAVPPLYLRTFAGMGKPVVFVFGPPLGGKAYGSIPRAGFMIPKQGVKTEKELRTVLTYFDKLRSPEGEKMVSAYIEANETAPADKKVALEDIQQNHVNDAFMYAKPGTANYKMANERLAKFADVAIMNPAAALISPTNVEKGSQLTTILKDASIKFVLDEIDEKGFAAAVAEWKKVGGDKVAQEYAGLYKP